MQVVYSREKRSYSFPVVVGKVRKRLTVAGTIDEKAKGRNQFSDEEYKALSEDALFVKMLEEDLFHKSNPKQEAKANNKEADLQKKIDALEADKAKLQGQVTHLSKNQKPKSGGKPGPKPK